MKKIYLLSCLCFIMMKSSGQLLTETFNYAPDPTLGLAAQSAGIWRIVNTGDSMLIDAGNLSYSGLVASTGNKVKFDGSGTDYYADFPSQTTGTVYRSFILNVSSLGGMNATGAYFNGFIQSGSTTLYGGAVWSRLSTTPGRYNIGISTRSNSVVTWLATDLTPGIPCFIVVTYVFNPGAGDDVSRIWLNPAIGGSEPAADATAAIPATDLTSAARILLRQEAVTTTPFIEFDELRVGTTWAQVTPSATTASLGVAPSSLVFASQTVGTQSVSQSFNLSGSNLTGAPNDITVNSPSTDFQVSNNNASWGASTTIAYTSSTLSPTPVYVRFTPLTGGPKSGNITFSGGGVAIPPTVALTGLGTQTYYSKSTGNLTDVATWGTVSDGTGTSPADFTSDGQIFIISNRVTAVTLNANWTVSGAGSKVIVGDGTATELIIPTSAVLTGLVDVSNLGWLYLENPVNPTLGTMATGSLVTFAQAGTSVIPAGAYYNLYLLSGSKTLSPGTTTVNGNFTLDFVTGFNGSPSPFSTINLAGNFVMLNGSAFEPNGSGDANRLTLILTGSGTQTLSGNGGDMYFFRLVTPALPAASLNIIMTSVGLHLGNTTSGGLNMQQATHTLTIGSNSLTIQQFGFFSPTNVGTITGSSNSDLIINKTGGSALGSVGFTSGSQLLGDLTINSTGAANNNLTLTTPLTVTDFLTLTSGNILLGANDLAATATIVGGSAASHVVTNGTGALTINNVGATNVLFPVGPTAALYHPVTINNAGTPDNFSVNLSSASAPACVPAVASVTETWNITEGTPGGSDCTLTFDFTGAATGASFTAAGAQITHCTGATADYHNGSVTGSVATGSGFMTFSPFGITNDASVLPVSFGTVKASQQTGGIKVEWTNLTETNIQYYSVERSADGNAFSTIVTANAVSNDGSRVDYNILDMTAADGVNYYRINAHATNGSNKYSIIVKVNTKGGKTDIVIYPNPVSGNQVSFQATALPKGQYTVRVINAGGQQVFSKSLLHNGGGVTESLQLPATIKTGMYSLQLSGGEINLTKTFIIR